MSDTINHQLTPLNRPFTLTDEEWCLLTGNVAIRERFDLAAALTSADVEALCVGALSTFAVRFDIDDYHAVYILQDNALTQPPLVLTYQRDGRLCLHPCPDHPEPHVSRPIP